MVASDPVTDRFGPRSTPVRSAPVTCGGADAAVAADPAISPTGRLFIRLQASATIAPAIQLVAAAELRAAICSTTLARSIAPVRANPSTITKKAPTRRSRLH